MRQYNSIPQNPQNFLEKGVMARVWYFFLSSLWTGLPPSAESAVTVGTSPFAYTAKQRGFMIVQGGSVSLVQYSRDGVTNHTTGQTQGCFPLSQGDLLIVTYSVAPAMTWVPQ